MTGNARRPRIGEWMFVSPTGVPFHSHGTPSAYNAGCPCDACRECNRLRIAKNRAVLRRQVKRAPHGTETAYLNWGCRCGLCRKAGAEANAKQRARRKAGRG